jgi:hypothetical protein
MSELPEFADIDSLVRGIESTPDGRKRMKRARINLAKALGATILGRTRYMRLLRGEGPPCPRNTRMR